MTVQDMLNQLIRVPGHLRVLVTAGTKGGGSTSIIPGQAAYENTIFIVFSDGDTKTNMEGRSHQAMAEE